MQNDFVHYANKHIRVKWNSPLCIYTEEMIDQFKLIAL